MVSLCVIVSNLSDYVSEKQALHNEEKMGDLPLKVQQAASNGKKKPAPTVVVPDSYVGPRLAEGSKVTPAFIEKLVLLFTSHAKGKASDSLLHEVYAKRIIEAATHALEKESCFHDLSIPRKGSLTVVGDTHGQLLDVLTIFKMRGMPSSTNVFLFNGDFVDRGPHGVEVLLLLFALKASDPSSIYLNRGNHEHRRMNARYSFEDQGRL